MTSEPKCWVISDGRRGIENQALGLAEACQRMQPLKIETHKLKAHKPFKALPAAMQLRLQSKPSDFGLKGPFPDIAIGCGRQAIAPLRSLKQAAGADIFTIYIQDPRIDPNAFDLVIAPEHDNLSGENVKTTIGSPNRITNNQIVAGVMEHGERLAALPMPRIAMLIGGDSKSHKLTPEIHKEHLRAANNALASERSLLITTSRRTPEFAVDSYREFARKNSNVWLYDGEGPNPYFAFLGGADTLLVTEDSTNMLTEACTTGKTVFTLPMAGKPGKFQHLYDRLSHRCNLKPYETLFTGPQYEPLRETDKAAEYVWQYYNKRKA